MRIFSILILFLIPYISSAQISLSKGALRQLEKGKDQRAMELVYKAIGKDSTLSAPYFVKAYMLFQPDLPFFNLDSSYYFILQAQRKFSVMTGKNRLKHERAGIDSVRMELLKQSLDSAAFARAEEQDSENGFIYFLDVFASAKQTNKAITRRNELAFTTALHRNTYQSYHDFFQKYPDAAEVNEAKSRYEKLYFYEKTVDKRLVSFTRFLREHPGTPYRKEAEEQIYQIMTAPNSPKSYLDFLKFYPKSELRQKSIDFLYHVLKEEKKDFPSVYLSDSLKQVRELEAKVLFPFMDKKRYGYMDSEGHIIRPPDLEQIDQNDLCGGITLDYLFANEQMIGLDGSPVFTSKFDETEDLGYGILKIILNRKVGAIHKSGRNILPIAYQDVRLVNGMFLAYQQNDMWGLKTVTGRDITKPLFTEISWIGPFVVFANGKKFAVKKESQLLEAIDQNPLDFDLKYTDYELVGESSFLWVKSERGEAIIDKTLKEIIPMAQQKIKILNKGYYVERNRQFYILDTAYRPLTKSPAQLAYINESWVAMKNTDKWSLYDMEHYRLKYTGLDSVQLMGNHFALIYYRDTSTIITGKLPVVLEKGERITLISTNKSNEYLLIDKLKEKSIINTNGETIYKGKIDDAKPLGPDYVVLSGKGGKKGMVSGDAAVLLPFEFEAIGNYSNGYVSLLAGKQFGMYNQRESVFIPAQYEKNITPYNKELFIAQKDGHSGLVDKDNRTIVDFEYDEIQYWNDSVALVKRDKNWHLFDFIRAETVGEYIRSIRYIKKDPDEIIAICLKEKGYGVLSNVSGEIIAATYNDILNVGTMDNPVYFTEKHVEEAGYYVVIYYDNKGKIIYKQAYESIDYPKIYCDN